MASLAGNQAAQAAFVARTPLDAASAAPAYPSYFAQPHQPPVVSCSPCATHLHRRLTYFLAPLVALLLAMLLAGCAAPETQTPLQPTPTPPARATPTATAAMSSDGLPPPTPCAGCWIPPQRVGWQWQLDTPLDPAGPFLAGVAVYDIDLFDNSAAVVQALHASGRHAVCYIDAGSWENWRPDAARYPAALLGASNGWAGERWLDIGQLAALLPILTARVALCQAKGFDSVEFDEVDGYTNTTGFPLTAADQLRFNVALANLAHAHHLSVALKNDRDQVAQLLPYFDWALEEQCFQYDECAALAPFTRAGKAVMDVEYALAPAQFCPQANPLNFNAMKKNLALDAPRAACR